MHATVMGSQAHVIVVGDPGHEQWAIDRLQELEDRWSRFRPTSEIAALNRAGGEPVRVSAETLDVIERALAAWTWTAGLFDPTVHEALCAIGYDRSFASLAPDGPAVHAPARAPGCGQIDLDRGASTITMPPHVTLDLGGIAKGYAADLVLAELLARGAEGACVNVGGDVAVAGTAPTDRGWIVGLDSPFQAGSEILQLCLSAGAVATSSRLRRRWRRGGVALHHIIDPRSGTSTRTDVASVSVIAGSAADAEVLTKVIMLEPDASAALLAGAAAAAIVIDERRLVRCLGGIEAFVA